jgi:hypothetical protein
MSDDEISLVGLLMPVLDGSHKCLHDGKMWDDGDPLATMTVDGVQYHLFTSRELINGFLPLAAKSMGIEHIKARYVIFDERAALELLELVDSGEISVSLDAVPDQQLSGCTAADLLPRARGDA